ncbi:hypothetical protein SNOUR_21860 [Streptomyces noursei ATCC 11455]|nr:hypothetical protein SNOUR_21860 [Streptomyces noursei ATCC 11455]
MPSGPVGAVAGAVERGLRMRASDSRGMPVFDGAAPDAAGRAACEVASARGQAGVGVPVRAISAIARTASGSGVAGGRISRSQRP